MDELHDMDNSQDLQANSRNSRNHREIINDNRIDWKDSDLSCNSNKTNPAYKFDYDSKHNWNSMF